MHTKNTTCSHARPTDSQENPAKERISRHEAGGPASQPSARLRKRHHIRFPSPRPRNLQREDIVMVEEASVRQAVLGTSVGNFMEWFDFGIYGYLTVVMTTVFTKGLPNSLGVLIMLLGFAVSFLARPLGGFVLGPLGDRIGRQKVLFITMSVMAVSTSLIGALPTAAQIGLWAPLPLYVLKMIQGFSTGGEYAGAATYVSEFSPDKRRGFFSSWLDVGSYLGFAAGAGAVALTTMVSERYWGADAMVNGAWRIPYFLAIPLGIIAVYFRSRIPETPHFEMEDSSAEDERPRTRRRGHWRFSIVGPKLRDERIFGAHSLPGVFRHFHKEILLGILLVAAGNTLGYVLTSYMPTYLSNELGESTTDSAVATIPVLILVTILMPFAGRLSDRFGRKPVFVASAVISVLAMIPAFMLINSGSSLAMHLSLILLALPVAGYVSVIAAALPALFPTASRFGGMAITYNVGVSLFGGTTPFIVQSLIELTGNAYMPALYVMLFSILGGIAVLFIPETAGRNLMGSMPAVASAEDASEILATQQADPNIDLDTMPVDAVAEAWKVPDNKGRTINETEGDHAGPRLAR
ncbi:MAG: MFS transporter [Bifidobacterium sp.]|uniref:MFS transporter n=1 Tax=Bifidobacterium sp. TaxID=41200 RepID=UPI0039ECCDA6